jgi:hypothetical protein
MILAQLAFADVSAMVDPAPLIRYLAPGAHS